MNDSGVDINRPFRTVLNHGDIKDTKNTEHTSPRHLSKWP
jgi:hypothetical protein